MSKLGHDKRQFLFEIIQKQIGEISTSENKFKESLESMDDYEYICNACLELFEQQLKYKDTIYFSSAAIGHKAYDYLVELRDWLNDLLKNKE